MLIFQKNEDDTMTQPILQHFGQVIHHEDPQAKPRNTGLGRCILVVTGLGESHLLGASTVTAIQAATMLLVDDRVNKSVVALAMPGARVIHVGKRSSHQATPQAFVENLIMMAVREGEQVVHLQVGDPLATHSGSDERSRLQAAGVDVGSFSDHPGAPQGPSSSKLSQNRHDPGQSNRF
jgi:hypothetical protein